MFSGHRRKVVPPQYRSAPPLGIWLDANFGLPIPADVNIVKQYINLERDDLEIIWK